MESNPHFLRCLNFVVNFAAIGVEVKMIRNRRTAAQNQLTQPNFGTDIDRLRSHLGPNGVKEFEPLKKNHAYTGANGPGESLVKVMVAVDQAGDNHAAAGIYDLVEIVTGQVGPSLGDVPVYITGRTNPQDAIVFHSDSALLNFMGRRVHRGRAVASGHQDNGIFYK
jgi:hypothetical protein